MPSTGRADTPVELTTEAIDAFAETAKIALLATVNAQKLPHVSLITSMQAKDPRQLMFGQFSEGLSKQHVKDDPRTAFLVMSRDKKVWRGKARWTGETRGGADYEMYNRKPMFRYNSYFGIHTVHYLDLIELMDEESVSTAGVAAGSLVTMIAKRVAATTAREAVLKPWAEELVSRVGTLKFLSYVGADGYPTIVPVLPCQAAGAARLVFAPLTHRTELAAIEAGAVVAVFALNLQMESVLVRGRFGGYRRYAGLRAGAIDIDWVYNSMPPLQGQLYPAQPVVPVGGADRSAWLTPAR